MNYEKKYKEIVGQLKKAYLYAQTDSTKAVLEEIFPELKESEDERIRKELLELVKRWKEKAKGFCPEVPLWPTDEEDCDRYIAWLEKQGEPMEINPTEFDTRLQTLIGKFDNLPKEELIGSLSFWLNVVQNDGTYKDEEKQSEQKPAWSEEDEEELFNAVYACLNFYGKDSDTTDWLKSLKQRIGG